MGDTAQELRALGRHRVLVIDPEGPALLSPGDVTDLIGQTWGLDVDWVAVPLARLPPDFLRLSTRVAGEIIQKFINYGLKLAILGDTAELEARSEALAAFVRESNRGSQVWFAPSLEALAERLGQGSTGA